MTTAPDEIGATGDDRGFVRNVDWNLFPVFVEIARAGGIGAAARRLNRQQPTVSLALKRLEDQLGVALCRRSATGIEVTPAGKALLDLCEDMLESVRMVPHQVAQAMRRIEGRVRIQLISSVIAPELDEAIASFHRRHPHVVIELSVAPWRRVLDALSNGAVEVGIGYDSSEKLGLRYTPLLREVQQLYCSRWHPLYGRHGVPLTALADESFVLTGGDEPEPVERFRRRHGLGTRVAGVAEDLHEARRLIGLGVGIGLLPTLVGEAGGHGDPLWPLLPEAMRPDYHIFLITRDAAAVDTATQLFLDELHRRLRAHRAS